MPSSFPRGVLGLGLLTLRVTVAIAVIILGSRQLASGPFSVISLAAIVLAMLVTVGLFTSGSSAILGFLMLFLCFLSHTGFLIMTILAALCASLSMTGAGAYSIDGLLHGKQRIILLKPSQPDHVPSEPRAKG